MTDNYRDVAREFVATSMRLRGMSRAMLAKRSGLDAKTVRAFLDGTRWPQVDSREAIADAMHLMPGEIDWIAEHGEPRKIGDVDPLDLARDNPARLSEDDAPEVMSTRRRADSAGRLYMEGDSLLMYEPDGTGSSRLEVRFWPGDGREIRGNDLMVVMADAHSAIRDRVVRTGLSEPLAKTDVALAADEREQSIAGEQEQSDTP